MCNIIPMLLKEALDKRQIVIVYLYESKYIYMFKAKDVILSVNAKGRHISIKEATYLI